MRSKQGHKQLARTLLERAVELEPDFSEAYSSLAALAADQGSLAKAELLHRLALQRDTRNADVRNNYGTFLQTQGQFPMAIALLKVEHQEDDNAAGMFVLCQPSLGCLREKATCNRSSIFLFLGID